MKIDVITIEIGSTITKVNAFNDIFSENIKHVGQSTGLTSFDKGDVSLGVEEALENLKKDLGQDLTVGEYLINSSAAGGLRMAVFGLTYAMTARAAREASLGAGAILEFLGTGKIQQFHLEDLYETAPNIVMLAGGLDYGDTEITLHNAKMLASSNLNTPFIYSGNCQLQKSVKRLFEKNGKTLHITKNVYPDVDQLDIDEARKIIQHTFSQHIIHASGMEKLQKYTEKEIIPTPYAVLTGAERLYRTLGDLVVIDVGGATTDIHSVSEDSPENAPYRAQATSLIKRTVEGDLGVYVNAKNLNSIDDDIIDFKADLSHLRALPENEEEKKVTEGLAAKAVSIGLRRHAGTKKVLYSPTGRKTLIYGKDLTRVKTIIGTGGSLSKLENSKTILENIRDHQIEGFLLPTESAKVKIDKKYIFSSIGTLAFHYKDAKIENLLQF